MLPSLPGAPVPLTMFVVVPPVAGITAATRHEGRGEARFIDQMRELRFDLALQMHGGGRYANPSSGGSVRG